MEEDPQGPPVHRHRVPVLVASYYFGSHVLHCTTVGVSYLREEEGEREGERKGVRGREGEGGKERYREREGEGWRERERILHYC